MMSPGELIVVCALIGLALAIVILVWYRGVSDEVIDELEDTLSTIGPGVSEDSLPTSREGELSDEEVDELSRGLSEASEVRVVCPRCGSSGAMWSKRAIGGNGEVWCPTCGFEDLEVGKCHCGQRKIRSQTGIEYCPECGMEQAEDENDDDPILLTAMIPVKNIGR